MTNKISNGQIAKASKWSALAEIMAKIASPIVNIFLARLLAPEVFGVIASITIITSFADIFTDAGFQRYIIQHEFKDEIELEKYTNVSFWANLFLSVLIFGLIAIFNQPLAVLVGCPSSNVGLVASAFAVICTSFSSTATARYRRKLDFKPLFFSRMISAFIPLVITVPLAFVFRNYWAMIIGTLAQKVFQSIYLTILCEWKPKRYFSYAFLKKMIPFSVWNLLESLAIWFGAQANVFIVAIVLNEYYLGLYKTGMATVNSYMAIITASVTPVLFSSLSRYQNEDKLYKETFFRFQKIISIIVIPMGIGLLLYSDFAVFILLGSKWKEVSSFLGLWGFMSSLTITYSNVASEVYRSKGKPIVSFVLQMIYMVIYVPCIIYGAYSGFKMLCLISCFIRFLPIAMDLITLSVMFRIKISRTIINTLPSLFCSVLMLALAVGLKLIYSSFLWDVVSIVICILFYFAASMIFRSNRSILFSIPKVKNAINKFTKEKNN